MAQPNQPPLTSQQMGKVWKVTPDTAVRWANQGLVEAERTPGGQWRFYGPLPGPPGRARGVDPDGTEDPTDVH